MSDYAYESDQIAFFEHAGWHYGDLKGVRKGVRINVSYLDTHVETIAVSDQGLPETWPAITPKDSMLPYEPFLYNNHVDSQGNEHLQQAPLRPNVRTGLCIDPSSNYDKLY